MEERSLEFFHKEGNRAIKFQWQWGVSGKTLSGMVNVYPGHGLSPISQHLDMDEVRKLHEHLAQILAEHGS
jgi:hypothetical protein